MLHKKTLLITLLPLSLFAITDTQIEIKELQQNILELQKEVKTLKKVNKIQADKAQDNFDELYDYTENVETRVLADKLQFGLALKFGSDFIEKTYQNTNTVKNNNILSTKFMLKLKADITKTLKFYGRLSMYKYWGNSIPHQYSYYDNMQGRVPSDSGLYVERAYVDWFFLKQTSLPMALTIGRQPSSDGPSHQFKDNVSRKATYSALLYDGVADGVVLTLNLSKLFNYDGTYFRFGYSRGFGYVNTNQYSQNPYIGAPNTDIQNTDVYGIFLDSKLPNIENSLIQLSASRMSNVIANPLDSNYDNNTNLGDMDLLGAMVEITNFQNKHIDMFAHYGYNITHPNTKSYTLPNGVDSGLLGDSKNSLSGYAYWLGGRYGFGDNAKYKIGAEYNHGSKNWVSLTQGSYDVYNKLASRGDAFEVYGMYVVNKYLNFRLGYLNINYDYDRSGWLLSKPTPIVEVPSDIPNEQSPISRLHSIYLKMNLAY